MPSPHLPYPSGTRLPRTLSCSVGVTGFNDQGSWRYIHTAGLPETEIVLADEPPQHLHLISSSAEITFSDIAPERAEFEARDLRPIESRC